MGALNKLLVLDDDSDMCAFVAHAAVSAGFEPASSTNFEQFKASLAPDTSVVVLDLMMPEVDGIQVLRYLSEQSYASGIILISGYDRKVLKVAAQLAASLGLDVRASIQKPFKSSELREVLAKGGEARRARARPGSRSP